jgi:Ca-activated chloride channel family protein
MQPFTHPFLLAALSALPVLSVLAWFASRRRQRALVALGGLAVGAVLLRRRPSRLRAFVLWLGLVCLAVGMAGPRWGRDWSQSAAPGRDLVVVVDLSRSMYAEAPSRVELAQKSLLDLAATLRQRGGHRVGLVVFAGRARLACPLTHDLDHFRDSVEALDVSSPDPDLGAGTRIGAGLSLAVKTHAESLTPAQEAGSGRSRSARDIILLSDGDDPARDGEWRTGIELAHRERIPIHCVALGDAVGPHRIPNGAGWLTYNDKEVLTRREDAPLQEIARRTNGRLIRAGARRALLGDEYLDLAGRAGDEDSPDALPVYRQRHRWFLLPCFVLLALTLVLPEVRGRMR